MVITGTNVTIMVKDMDKSISFYQSLGFALKARWGDHYAQITAPGITIGLHPAIYKTSAGSGIVSIGFKADNFEEVQYLLADLSIVAESRTEEGGQFIHFADPDGTMLYFIKPQWG